MRMMFQTLFQNGYLNNRVRLKLVDWHCVVVEMPYNYIALMFFVIIGLLIPALFLFAARLLGNRAPGNPVKNAPYESAEETIGSSRGIDNEYLPYLMLFLPFEIVLAMLILWSTVAKAIDYNISLAIISLAVISTVFSFVGYKLIGGRIGRAKALYR